MLEGCAIFFCNRTLRPRLGRTPQETTPDADIPPFYHSQTHPQRRVGRTYTATSYADGDLEGRYPVVVRCDGSLFLSSLLIVESDRPIYLISFYETDDRVSLSSRTDIGTRIISFSISISQIAFCTGDVIQLRRPMRFVLRVGISNCFRQILWTARTLHKASEAIGQLGRGAQPQVLGSGAYLKELTKKLKLRLATRNSPFTCTP
jgi:hypothetical protein